jgi:hypothetical protein
MTSNGRQSVKKRVLTRQETLQRLRDECTDRMVRDKEALKNELRGSLNRGIKDLTLEIDEADIDSLIEDFFREFPTDDFGYIDDVLDEDEWKPGLMKCPLCASGWLLEPYPNVVTCDGCVEMCFNVSLADLAGALDSVIRHHAAACNASNLKFSASNRVLYSSCQNCGFHGPVVQS